MDAISGECLCSLLADGMTYSKIELDLRVVGNQHEGRNVRSVVYRKVLEYGRVENKTDLYATHPQQY